jgi:Tfp pilus assembly protein PilO
MLADKLKHLNSSSRRVLLMALVAVAVVAIYSWVLSPFRNQLMAAQRYNLVLDSSIRKVRVLDATLEAKKTKLEELKKTYAPLCNELFTQDEARDFLASLPATIRSTGCSVQSISSVPEQRGGSQNQPDNSGIAGKKAQVTVVGGYNSIVKLFDSLQTCKRKVWIESVRMDTGSGAGKLKCQLTLTLYCVDSMETTVYE